MKIPRILLITFCSPLLQSCVHFSEKSKDYVAPVFIQSSCQPFTYPKEAVLAGYEGETSVKIFLNANGNVQKVTTEKSSGFKILDSATEAFYSSCSFKPAQENGRAIASTKQLKFKWKLEGKSSD